MKNLYLHSITDVTTNSSSEMFICDTKDSIGKAKKTLNTILECYNKTFNKELKFGDVFGEIRLCTDKDKEIASHYKVNEYVPDMINRKTLIIHSKDCNSIPYEIWQWINSSLNGTNLHLG